MKDITLLTEKGGDGFYPTPAKMIEKMIDGLDWLLIKTVLEPSAGKGDIAKAIAHKKIDIDCIEKDTYLQHILKGEGFRLMHDDFLTYKPYKKYDLIIMNPPFADGDKHLLQALKIQKNGGSIVCLLNAETINNPFTYSRQELVKLLEQYNAKIEFIDGGFVNSERKTSVKTALVKIYIPQAEEESSIYESMKKAAKVDDVYFETKEMTVNDYISQAVSLFEAETRAGLELIKQYKALKPYLSANVNQKSYDKDLLRLVTLGDGRFGYDDGHNDIDPNAYLKHARLKYWRSLFANPKFTSNFTSKMIEKHEQSIDKMAEYDFSEFNIRSLMIDLNAEVKTGIEEAIMLMFDRLTSDHSWYPETQNNVHYYNGWAHNKAHKINKKVILPCYGVFDNYFNKAFRSYKAVEVLRDIEKVLNYFDGNMTAPVYLGDVIASAEANPKNIDCKFFKVTFYKKGTVHITFTNLELLERFNIYASQQKRWLPPDYGRRPYKDMSQEAKQVIDDFQGENAYNKVLANSNYYLSSPVDSVLMIGG